ncbi:MAG TPA: uracil-DNA glycosylase family protein [Gallionella sp.]|nr:uracil-DNA glycosylase family protein [Gallionella sp.]
MDRQEAVLRELNLYPQWVLRNPPVVAEETLADAASSGTVRRAGSEISPASMLAEPAVLEAAPLKIEQAMEPVAAAVAQVGEIAPVAVQAVAMMEVPLSEEYAPDLPMPDDGHWGESMPDAVEAPSLLSTLDWTGLKQKVRDCTICKLRAGCSQTVFGVGDEQADWLFVGEAPGEEEDARGEPFVGQSGMLLDNMLLALKLKRTHNVYIANIVKCHPPENRVPDAEEIAACLPYLHRQIELIQPRVIVALGKTAATALLGHRAALGPLRGTVHDFNGIPLIATYHPAYLLRSPLDKARAWQDLCLAQKTILTQSGRQR